MNCSTALINRVIERAIHSFGREHAKVMLMGCSKIIAVEMPSIFVLAFGGVAISTYERYVDELRSVLYSVNARNTSIAEAISGHGS